MMCAIRIDQKPRLPESPAVVNSASSDEPMTTSGVAIGRKISTLVAARPRNRCRTSANAIRVPSTVAPSVARNPICRLVTTEAHMPARPARVQPVVPGERVESVGRAGSRASLNDISTTKKIGRNM